MLVGTVMLEPNKTTTEDHSLSEEEIVLRSDDLRPTSRASMRPGGKRTRTDRSESASSVERGVPIPISKRGRGRPTNSGEISGLAKAKAEKKKLEDAQKRLDAEREIAQKSKDAESSRLQTRSLLPSQILLCEDEDQEQCTASLKEIAKKDLSIVLEVAAKSGNMKGTFQKAIKGAAASLSNIVDCLAERSLSEETRQLHKENERLRREVEELRKEMRQLRDDCLERQRAVSPAPAASNQDELVQSIVLQVGGMMNARFEAIEERLLPAKPIRPPLGQKSTAPASRSFPGPRPAAASSAKAQAPKKQVPKAAGPNEVSSGEHSGVAAPRLPMPASTEEWTLVSKRGRPKTTGLQVPAVNLTAKGASKAKNGGKKKKRKAKLRTPRSAAITITLPPNAEDSGLTYGRVLADAKSKIDLEQMEIAGLKFRMGVTGARILELPGTESGPKADLLASKLKEVLPEGVKVTRPTKSAEIRVSGLDDSVSKEDVTAAVVQRSGCRAEHVKVGEIRRNKFSGGSVWVQCPVTAASMLAETGRLLVGWSSARVVTLEPRPMKCFRCLAIGHTGLRCTSAIDRSRLCFRCGKPDHKAATCSAKPHCPLCADANRPADHLIGGKSCAPPPKNKKVPGAAPAVSQISRSKPLEEATMPS